MGSSNVKRPARASRGGSLTHGGARGAVARSLRKTVGSFLKNKKTRHTPTMRLPSRRDGNRAHAGRAAGASGDASLVTAPREKWPAAERRRLGRPAERGPAPARKRLPKTRPWPAGRLAFAVDSPCYGSLGFVCSFASTVGFCFLK